MENRKPIFDRFTALLALLIISTTIFRIAFIQWGPLGLAPDEAQYWMWSERLDLSYYSKGPVIAYLIAFFTAVAGDTELGVRLGAVVLSAAVTAFIFIFTLKLFRSPRAAFFASLVANVTPLFSAGSIIMTTDTPMLLFWAATVYSFYRATTEGKLSWWIALGVAAALGMLTKYSMGVIYPCLFLFLLISKSDRRWLARKEPYIAIAISLLCFVPEIIWNAQHGWPTFKHVLGQTHAKEGFKINIKDFLGFAGGQVGVLGPLVFCGVIYGIYRAGVEGFRGRREYLLLFLTSAPILAFFLLKSLQAKVEVNWASFAYFSAIIAGAVVLDKSYAENIIRGRSNLNLKVFVTAALITGAALTGVAHYPDILNRFGLHLKKTPVTMLQGWRELGPVADRVYTDLKKEGPAFVMSDRYQIATELAFYMPSRPMTYNINLNRRMNQFDIWEGFTEFKGYNAVYVEWVPGPLTEKVSGLFDRCEPEPPLEIEVEGRIVKTFYIYRCYGFAGMVEPEFIKW
jgi:undecaprenyl-diphosphatase